MKTKRISESELVLNPDGSVYHLKLKAHQIADTVLLVGDQDGVQQISRHFDRVLFRQQNREFVTHTGVLGNKNVTVLSSGIGTDNIDIVLNELYAAVNIAPETRTEKEEKRKLNIIRLGTTGAIQPDLNIGEIICSSYGLGLDGQMYFYNYPFNANERELQQAFQAQIEWSKQLSVPYFTEASRLLMNRFSSFKTGITASGTGFYGPQGRNLRLQESIIPVQDLVKPFEFKNYRITNFDMETSSLYGLGRLFGFACCTLNVVIANRATGQFAKDHKAWIENFIKTALTTILD